MAQPIDASTTDIPAADVTNMHENTASRVEATTSANDNNSDILSTATFWVLRHPEYEAPGFAVLQHNLAALTSVAERLCKDIHELSARCHASDASNDEDDNQNESEPVTTTTMTTVSTSSSLPTIPRAYQFASATPTKNHLRREHDCPTINKRT